MTNQPDCSRPTKVDYRKFTVWVGLNGPRPSNAELAFYLEIELGNREEVDAIEAAVLLEAIEILKASPPIPKDILYTVLSNHIPSEMIDSIWQELSEALEPKL